MSHFMVFVAGADVREALAPYHEYECTGLRDKYVQEIDHTEQVCEDIKAGKPLSECLSCADVPYNVYSTEEEARKQNDDYGFCVVSDGVVKKAVQFTNPNYKWDWWVVGGRYSSRLLLKDGRQVDSATKAEIDFEGLEHTHLEMFREQYDSVREALGEDILRELQSLTDDQIRVRVDAGELPPRAAGNHVTMSNGFKMFNRFDHGEIISIVRMEREDYAQVRVVGAWAPYALVTNDGWLSRGSMGWFGISCDEIDYVEYLRRVRSTIEALPDDTLITVVDCHI